MGRTQVSEENTANDPREEEMVYPLHETQMNNHLFFMTVVSLDSAAGKETLLLILHLFHLHKLS